MENTESEFRKKADDSFSKVTEIFEKDEFKNSDYEELSAFKQFDNFKPVLKSIFEVLIPLSIELNKNTNVVDDKTI